VTNISIEPLARAEAVFEFLGAYGLRLAKRHGPEAARGPYWSLRYEAPRLVVTVGYADYQFDVTFEADGQRVEYFYLDQHAFDRRSGYHGNMFPPDERLPAVIDHVADDIRSHFQALLSLDAKAWEHAVRIMKAPLVKKGLP